MSSFNCPYCEIKREAKMMVEEMVYDHFGDQKRYYEEICEEFDRENESQKKATMWKRVNPNVEYVIATMRKKGEDTKNGISKIRRSEESKPAVKAQCHSCS